MVWIFQHDVQKPTVGIRVEAVALQAGVERNKEVRDAADSQEVGQGPGGADLVVHGPALRVSDHPTFTSELSF